MANVDKTVIASTPRESDLASFHDDSGRAEDFQAFMEGEQNALGGQHDLNPRGMTTDVGEFNQPPDFSSNPLIPDQPAFIPGQVQAPSATDPAQGNEWRVRYGRSENEKGEFRRLLEESLAREAKLVQQFLAAPAPGPVAPYPNPYDHQNGYAQSYQPSYSQVPPQVGSYQPAPLPQRFVNKPDGEMVYAEDLEATIQARIAPAFAQAYEEVQRLRAGQDQMRASMAERDRMALGITPQLEAQALMEQPWLRNVRHDPASYHGGLANWKAAFDARQTVQRTSPSLTPSAPAPGTSQSAARRVTYIEPASGNGGGFEPHNQPTDFQRELAAATAEPHIGKRAGKMREVFAKYGMGPQNDFRDPSMVTR